MELVADAGKYYGFSKVRKEDSHSKIATTPKTTLSILIRAQKWVLGTGD